MIERSKWSLIGIPDHLGVSNVSGRVGAAEGPAAFRRMFKRLKGRRDLSLLCMDAGDAGPMVGEVAKNHRLAADRVREAHRGSGRSVVVGGGHDHGYSHLLGIAEALGGSARLGCINIDAHLDVRKPSPLITSGSPFYLALETGLLNPKRFIEFGIQSHCNAPELWTFVEDRKVQVVPFEKLRSGAAAPFKKTLRALARQCDAIAISLDLDAAAQAYAPGVSAPQAEGFAPTDIVEMMEIAGAHPKVISLGIFELNPLHDLDDRTARLAATAAYHFLDYALR